MSDGAEQSTSSQSRCDDAQRALEELLELMGAEATVGADEGEEQIKLSIEGEDAGGLIGKKGKTLDALQFLVNKIVSRKPGEHKLVVVDSEGYRERREASLVELAQRLADKVLDEQKTVRLNPMSARDRRIIHLTLRDVEGLCTESEGEGEERRLLIIPD